MAMPPMLVEVKTSGRHARDIVGAWSWGYPPHGSVTLALAEWIARCEKAAPCDGVAVIIRRASAELAWRVRW
jgi:hypothetical protein